MPKAKKPPQLRPAVGKADPEQSQRFIEAARELGADQSEEAFDQALRQIAKAPVPARPRPKNKRA